eukprot:scaffold1390_cov138-Cylindrotheca_fusiformis.AAC.63
MQKSVGWRTILEMSTRFYDRSMGNRKYVSWMARTYSDQSSISINEDDDTILPQQQRAPVLYKQWQR